MPFPDFCHYCFGHMAMLNCKRAREDGYFNMVKMTQKSNKIRSLLEKKRAPVLFLGQGDLLENGTATYSSILAW